MPGSFDKEGCLAQGPLCTEAEWEGELVVRPSSPSSFHQISRQYIIFNLNFKPYINTIQQIFNKSYRVPEAHVCSRS